MPSRKLPKFTKTSPLSLLKEQQNLQIGLETACPRYLSVSENSLKLKISLITPFQ